MDKPTWSAEKPLQRSDPIRVAIVEDDANLLELLRRYVNRSPRLSCVGAYATGEEALRQLPLLNPQPNLVLMDLHLPGISGVDCIELLRLNSKHVKIVVLTGEMDRAYVLAATRAGADGYVTKPCSKVNLVRMIEETMAGHNSVSSTVAGHLMAAVASGPHGVFRPHPKLSARENEVMRWLAQGLENKEIAERLGVSVCTVNAHLQAIYDKLGVRNRVEALRMIGQHGVEKGS